MKVALAHSVDPSTPAAADEILSSCRRQLGGERPQAGVLFACMDADHQVLLRRIDQAFPGLELIGCTTDGELSSAMAFQEDSIALMLFASRRVQIRAGVGRELSRSPHAAAQRAVASAQAGLSGAPGLCVALPESLQVSGVSVVRALSDLLGSTPLVGGTSGDQWLFEGTRQFYRDQVLSDSLPILLFSGELQAAIGVASGWEPVGRSGVVTRAEGSLVHEIDGAPAMRFYKQHFGGHVQPNPEYPLGVLEPNADALYLRAPFFYDDETGAVTFAGDVPVGAQVQITSGGRRAMLDACRVSVAAASAGFAGAPSAALVFSCAARKQLLGTRTGEEYQMIAEDLSPDLPVVGFYSYGEIAPCQGQTVADFHNETFVTLLIGERA